MPHNAQLIADKKCILHKKRCTFEPDMIRSYQAPIVMLHSCKDAFGFQSGITKLISLLWTLSRMEYSLKCSVHATVMILSHDCYISDCIEHGYCIEQWNRWGSRHENLNTAYLSFCIKQASGMEWSMYATVVLQEWSKNRSFDETLSCAWSVLDTP